MAAEDAADDKVLIGLTHADDDPESVLIAYLMGVEAIRAGKQARMWLTKEGVRLATEGFVGKLEVPGAPSISGLHAEFVDGGGQLQACPVCVKVRELDQAELASGASVAGAPAVYEFTDGGALVFNY